MARLKFNDVEMELPVSEQPKFEESNKQHATTPDYVTKDEIHQHLETYRNVINGLTLSIKNVNDKLIELNDKVENSPKSEIIKEISTCECKCIKAEVIQPKVEQITIHKDHDHELLELSSRIDKLNSQKDKVVEVRYKKAPVQKLMNACLIVSITILAITHFL